MDTIAVVVRDSVIRLAADTLRQGVSSTDDTNYYVQLVTALAAVLAALLGPAIQWRLGVRQLQVAERAAERQIAATLEAASTQAAASLQATERSITSNRAVALKQQWIEQLRELFASYLQVAAQLSHRSWTVEDADALDLFPLKNELMLLQQRALIMLDDSEDHRQIIAEMKDLYTAASTSTSDLGVDHYRSRVAQFVKLTRQVIRDEQNRI